MPEKRDVTGFLKALLLGAALAVTAQKSNAAVTPPQLDRAPADDLTQRLERARTLLAAEQTGTAALIPNEGAQGAAQTMWWRNWGNWHPGWGNGGWRNIHWGNGGWGNGGWHNWHNWRNF
jgi:rSAM-associated Gly-rich repeat protein